MYTVNLGGEGEIPGVLNQQPPGCLGPNWRSVSRKTIAELTQDGHDFLICPNTALPFPDASVDIVYTNWVPLDRPGMLGPGVQSSEVERILKPGGQWVVNGHFTWTKP